MFLKTNRYILANSVSLCLCAIAFAESEEVNGSRSSNIQNSDSDLIELSAYVIEGQRLEMSSNEISHQYIELSKTADLSELISTQLVEASMVRKSAYGNEIGLRGFSQANLPVMVDGGALEGACGSRKDPALSHINLLRVSGIHLQEGPFNVEKQGNLGGYVDVLTREPQEGFHGQVSTAVGSFDYYRAGAYVNYGVEALQSLFGYNYSISGQYEDGYGNSLWQYREGRAAPYNEQGKQMDAFKKTDVWGAVKSYIAPEISIILDYAYGLAENVMTPRVVFDIKEERTNLGRLTLLSEKKTVLWDELKVSIFDNEVHHNPNQEYRSVAVAKNVKAVSDISGIQIKANKETDLTRLKYGVDLKKRKWRADVFKTSTGDLLNGNLIPEARVELAGIYLQSDTTWKEFTLSSGIRYDDAQTKAKEELKFTSKMTDTNKNNDSLLSAFVMGTYDLSDSSSIFTGVGRSNRLPTGAELYIQGNSGFFGNPDLEPTTNTEWDLGYSVSGKSWGAEGKVFYSDLSDYIYQVITSEGWQTYTNLDADIYGFDLKTYYRIYEGIKMEFGVAYQKGEKNSGYQDRDLGQMSPMKTRLALDLDKDLHFASFTWNTFATLEWIHSEKASDVDETMGEQKLPSWDTINLKLGLQKGDWTFIVGADNLFDEAYAMANSYEWDIVGGTGANPVIINEPGRYVYSSLSYKW